MEGAVRFCSALAISCVLVSCQQQPPASKLSANPSLSEWRSKGWHYSVDDGTRFVENRDRPAVVYRFAAYPGPYFSGICDTGPLFSFSDDVIADWRGYYAADRLKFTVSSGAWRHDFELLHLAHGGSLQLMPDDYADARQYAAIGRALSESKGHISLAIGNRHLVSVPPSPLIGRFVEQCLRWIKQEGRQK